MWAGGRAGGRGEAGGVAVPGPDGFRDKGQRSYTFRGRLGWDFYIWQRGEANVLQREPSGGARRGLWLIVPLSVQPDHRPPGPKPSSDPPRERPDAAHGLSAALGGSVPARISQPLTTASCTLPSHFSFDLIIFPISSVS